MQREIAVKQQSATPGVIETIADGLSMALARPLLFLVPMLLDLYYWAGWKISVKALTSPIRNWVLGSDAAGADDVAKHLETIGKADITWLLSFFVPSLLSDTPRSKLYELDSRPRFAAAHWWIDLPLLLAMIVGAALLLAIFAVPIADVVLSRSRSVKETFNAIFSAWIRLMGTVLALVGIAALLLGPLAALSGILVANGVNAAPLFGLGAGLFLLVAYLSLWFAPDAIVVSEVGPFDAIKLSVAMLRGYFWQTIGLVAASIVIGLGLGEIWRELANTAPGLLLGVIANAFFATGLAIASMTFYANRIKLLQAGSVTNK